MAKLVLLKFPFEESIDFLGLVKYAWIMHDKNFQHIKYFTAELGRNIMAGKFKYDIYEYKIDDIDSNINVCKIFKGSFFAEQLEPGWLCKDNAMLD